MSEIRKKGRTKQDRSWMISIGAYVGLQIIFLIIDNSSWSPGFNKGAFFDRLTNSKFFTEWFTPYDIVQFNIFTMFFSITLLPAALIGAMKYFYVRKKTVS